MVVLEFRPMAKQRPHGHLLQVRGTRLKTCRELSRLTQVQVSERLDVSREAISLWETGVSAPSDQHKIALAALYGVTVDWLLSGKRKVADGRAAYIIGPAEELSLASVSIIGTISAGGLVEAWQEDLGTLEVPSRILQDAPRAFGLRVYGNSLASEWIYEGAIVVVDPDAPFIDGKIYAVRVDGGEVAARRVYDAGRVFKLVTGEGQVDEYPKRSVTLIGRVRWSFREH